MRTDALITPLLITGATGVAGFNAFPFFRERFGEQVIGTRPEQTWKMQHEGVFGVDSGDLSAVRSLFDTHDFNAVINCGGNCRLKGCEADPEMAHRINVGGVQNLLSAMAGRDLRFIHLSIDLVYSGTNGGDHAEDDIADPVTIYGKTMTLAEEAILTARPDATILRISLPMGVSFNGHAGAVDWIMSRFAKERPATLYYDEVRTPTYTDCLNELLLTLLNRNDMAGIYHAGAPRKMSLFQIAQTVNRVGGFDPDLLKGCYRFEAGPMPPRAGDVTMDSSRLIKKLGYQPFSAWPFDENLSPTDRLWHYDRPENEHRSPEEIARVLYRNPNRSRPNLTP